MGVTVVMTGVTSRTRAARIIVVVVGVATVVIVLRLLVCLSLAVLFAFHPTILEPDFDLTLRQIEVSCQLPTFLLGHVGIKKEFFFQLECLVFGVGLPLFSYTDMTSPMVQRITEAGGRKEEPG